MLAVPHKRRLLLDRPFFLPSDLSGLIAWYRFNQGITVEGAGVSVWADQSGNGNDLLQGTDTNRPSAESDGTVLFDGVDNYLQTNMFTLAPPYSIYFLGNAVSHSGADGIWDGNGFNRLALRQIGAGNDVELRGTMSDPSTSDWAEGASAVVSAVARTNNDVDIQINNGSITSGDPGASDMDGFTLGARSTGAAASNIQAQEVAVFSGADTTGQRNKMTHYLNQIGGVF